MASTADFKNGLCLEMNNDIFSIVEFQHVKPGKGAAFVRTKLKSLRTGKTLDKTFNAGEKVTTARVEKRPLPGLNWRCNQSTPESLSLSQGSFFVQCLWTSWGWVKNNKAV